MCQELSLAIFFLQNICLKGRIPPLRNHVFFVLLFHSYKRSYSHVSSPHGYYIYIYVQAVYFRKKKKKKKLFLKENSVA